ncbi:ribosome modulation factor [Simiduia aestuariiviva]|uniref:Ribosome modulation factor n=1 Tax=Simiduia aestuariiviva TaxID=1510459 RepID=A0A839UPZ3_9GAMM|nr:ribosome modulation factor [Simiduia aestuariiviva]MBB3168539.1 ribosome modulation factor [Simiduia aestuariiviva]
MKRQKRNQIELAFNKGYMAAIKGRSRDLCPHQQGAARQEWLSGWREAREDHWNGYNMAACAQKLSNLA